MAADKIDTRCEICKRNIRDPTKSWCGGCVKDVVYIQYPHGDDHVHYNSNLRYTIHRDENVPTHLPWTTFNGLIQVKKQSALGQALTSMDPNAEPGYKLVKKGKEFEKEMVEGFVRGLWTANHPSAIKFLNTI